MEKVWSMTTAVLLLCLIGTSCSQRSVQLHTEHQALRAVVNANNYFTTSLYKIISKRSGNVLFSPLSVETVLSMAWLGAGGQTAKEMATILYIPENRTFTEMGFRILLSHLQSLNKDVTLETANKIYAHQGAEVYPSFRQSAKRNFLAEIEEVNFRQNIDAARRINQWVAQKTRGKIRDLVNPDVLDFSTLMILVNAIYFKGKWLTEFNPRDTEPATFYFDAKTRRQIPMMHLVNQFPYGEDSKLKAKILQLPYVGERINMMILLPNEVDGLSNLEDLLAEEDLTQLGNRLTSTDVIVSIPRFKMEVTTDFSGPLRKLGLETIFGVNADFSGIAKHNLAVSDVLQKAFIEVNEEGSEAAAATDVQIVALSGANLHPIPKVFNADHPFLFLIQDEATGTILFIGRISSP